MKRLLPLLICALCLPALGQKQLANEIDDLAKQVSKRRGLPLKKPIARGVMTRDQIEKRILQRLAEDYAEADVAGEERGMKRLGLFPAELDYKEAVIRLLKEQIAGFYDPKQKELYIADWIADDLQKIVLVHEIDHALQDQNFDLVKFVSPNKENGDEQLARQALVEGDGVALMIEWMLPAGSDPWADDKMVGMLGTMSALSGGAELDKAPLLLKESLIFPYEKGLRFVATARKTRPWSDIDAMFAAPPISTEQIIHPEKYRAKEKPISVKPAAIPSLKGWKRVWSNVLGEMTFSVLFRQHGVERARAERAAEGWGGDRVQLYAPAGDDGKGVGQLVVIEQSVWDAEADAVEAYDALVASLGKLADKEASKEPTYAEWIGPGALTSFAERKGDRVVFVIGAPPILAQKIRSEAWSGWKK